MAQPQKLAEVRRLPLPTRASEMSDADLARAAADGDPVAQSEA